ncbi:MAG: hypothetical protein WCX29_03860, partial [Candidatus Peribacteraceae bacterium]
MEHVRVIGAKLQRHGRPRARKARLCNGVLRGCGYKAAGVAEHGAGFARYVLHPLFTAADFALHFLCRKIREVTVSQRVCADLMFLCQSAYRFVPQRFAAFVWQHIERAAQV